MSKKILGISCYYHDSSATLVIDGKIVSAVQEERFTRLKHDFNFPKESIRCMHPPPETVNTVSIFFDFK